MMNFIKNPNSSSNAYVPLLNCSSLWDSLNLYILIIISIYRDIPKHSILRYLKSLFKSILVHATNN